MRHYFLYIALLLALPFLLSEVVLAAECGTGYTKGSPDNWPTNPYWVTTPAPKGPGHKVSSVEQLKEHKGKDVKIGIKTNRGKDKGNIGTFEVGNNMFVAAAAGDLNSKITINHKGGGGKITAKVEWMDEKGEKVLQTEEIKGGVG